MTDNAHTNHKKQTSIASDSTTKTNQRPEQHSQTVNPNISTDTLVSRRSYYTPFNRLIELDKTPVESLDTNPVYQGHHSSDEYNAALDHAKGHPGHAQIEEITPETHEPCITRTA
jgi:hypothetical protein